MLDPPRGARSEAPDGRWIVLSTARTFSPQRNRPYDGWTLAGLLGRFGHDLTVIVDARLGSDWAENDEILAMLCLRHDVGATTREIAAVSGLHRRAVSRLVERLVRDGIVQRRRGTIDGRSVVVEPTARGRQCFGSLEVDTDRLFRARHDTAAEICDLLLYGPSVRSTERDALGLLERIVRAGSELVAGLGSAAGHDAMSGSQRSALVQIAAGTGLRPVDLVPTLGMGRSGVAYIVDQLCDKGLITRSRGGVAGDGRAVVLHVTPQGREAARVVADAATDQRLRLGPLFAAVRDWA